MNVSRHIEINCKLLKINNQSFIIHIANPSDLDRLKNMYKRWKNTIEYNNLYSGNVLIEKVNETFCSLGWLIYKLPFFVGTSLPFWAFSYGIKTQTEFGEFMLDETGDCFKAAW